MVRRVSSRSEVALGFGLRDYAIHLLQNGIAARSAARWAATLARSWDRSASASR